MLDERRDSAVAILGWGGTHKRQRYHVGGICNYATLREKKKKRIVDGGAYHHTLEDGPSST